MVTVEGMGVSNFSIVQVVFEFIDSIGTNAFYGVDVSRNVAAGINLKTTIGAKNPSNTMGNEGTGYG